MDYSQLRGHAVVEIRNTVSELPSSAVDGDVNYVVGTGLQVRASNAWTSAGGVDQATATALAIALG